MIHEQPMPNGWKMKEGALMIHRDPALDGEPVEGAVEQGDPGEDYSPPVIENEAAPKEFVFRGVKLGDWKSSTGGAFSSLRLSLGAAPLADAVESVDGFVEDAYRILWIASHNQDDWKEVRCFPVEWQQMIDKWADEGPKGEAVEAVDLAMRYLAAWM